MRMEDENHTQLYQKMCLNFPHLPKQIILQVVTQNSNDEVTCFQLLQQFHNTFHQPSFFRPYSPDITRDLPISELSNLNVKDKIGSGEDKSTLKNGTKNNGNRSISNAGFPNNYVSESLTARSQTAPVASGNCQGFNYAVYIPYGGQLYGTNNNIMYKPVLSGMENGVLLQVPPEGFLRSSSPHPEAIYPMSESPISANVNMTTTQTSLPSKSMPPTSAAVSWSPNLAGFMSSRPVPQQLSPGAIILTPQMSSHAARAQDTSPSATLNINSASPALNERFPRSMFTSESNQQSNEATNVDTQLHINIEPNDNPVHEWVPIQSFPGSPNYQHIPPLSLQFVPGHVNQHATGVYHPEVLPVDQISASMHPPSVWSQSSVPLVPNPAVSYGHHVYFPVSPSNALLIQSSETQKHLYLQRQRLNSLRYELEKTKLQYSKLKEESKEQELQSKSSEQNKDEVAHLKEEISSLNVQCYCLCNEVDQYSKGKALLGEINQDFYSSLNTGQQGPLLPSSGKTRPKGSCSHQVLNSSDEDEENKESSKWKCGKCTFANHPAISVCEICTEPRSVLVQVDCTDSGC